MSRQRTLHTLVLSFVILASLVNGSAPPSQAQTTDAPYQVFLPFVTKSSVFRAPWGIEVYGTMLSNDAMLQTRAAALGATSMRLNNLSWQDVQPTESGDYNWAALASFEADLRAAKRLGLQPIVIVDEHPAWARLMSTHACSAVRPDKLTAFANFMRALVTRYSTDEFNVHAWEIGNEPDVDPGLVPGDAVWGCWGDRTDYYYGGGNYGNMLRVVGPAIKATDPGATIVFGGLLLASSNTPDDANPAFIGKPERFLEGALRAGAAPYFDVLAYHGHSVYAGGGRDYSGADGGWLEYGSGPAKGKPAFLRSVMRRYDVAKPLWFNEASLGCYDFVNRSECAVLPGDFLEAQADHAVRMAVRTTSVGVENVTWYTLNGPSWRNGGLLDAQSMPRPSFVAYQQLIEQSRNSLAQPSGIGYGSDVEAYRFDKETLLVDVVWGIAAGATEISVPAAKFIKVVDRDGLPVATTTAGGFVRLQVGFGNVYIHRLP